MKVSNNTLRKLRRNNAHVVDYLNAYRRMGNVDFAVMITGPWGSGKTEFVKSWTTTLIQNDNDDKLDFLSVSLNGVETLDEIDSLLFRAAHKVLGGKSVRIAAKVLRNVVSAIKLSSGPKDGGAGLEFSIGDLKDVSFEKWIGDAPLLMFDDLERCCVDIESLMGYFDDLLKNGKKIILVCAEDEIEKRWKENSTSNVGRTLPSYAEICSKIVGKRFHIEAEIEDLYGVLVAQAECSGALGKFLIERRDVFIRGFKAVGEWADCRSEVKHRVHNYRAYKHALRDLAYWFGKLPKDERKNEGFLLDFARSFVLIDYALLSGALKVSDAFCCGEKLDARSEFEKLMDAGGVPWNAWDAPNCEVGVPAYLMKRMVFNESVNSDELKMCVRQSRYFVSNQRNEWQKLLDWNLLEDPQLEQLTQTVFHKIETFQYTKAEEILHVFSLLGEMAVYKVCEKDLSALTKKCQEYVAHLVAEDKLDIALYADNGSLTFDDRAMGFQFSGSFDDKPYYVSVRDIVLSAVRDVDAKHRANEISEMQDEFGKYPGRFYATLENPASLMCRGPIFDRVGVDAFYRGYCTLSNVDKNHVGRILYARASRMSFPVEDDFWRQLISRLRADVGAISGAVMPPSAFQKKVLAEQLEKILRNRQS